MLVFRKVKWLNFIFLVLKTAVPAALFRTGTIFTVVVYLYVSISFYILSIISLVVRPLFFTANLTLWI